MGIHMLGHTRVCIHGCICMIHQNHFSLLRMIYELHMFPYSKVWTDGVCTKAAVYLFFTQVTPLFTGRCYIDWSRTFRRRNTTCCMRASCAMCFVLSVESTGRAKHHRNEMLVRLFRLFGQSCLNGNGKRLLAR